MLMQIVIFAVGTIMIYLGIKLLVNQLPGVITNEKLETFKRQIQEINFLNLDRKKAFRNKLITDIASVAVVELTKKEKKRVLRKKISQLELLVVDINQNINYFFYPLTSLQKWIISCEEQLSRGDYDFLAVRTDIEKMQQTVSKNKEIFLGIEALFAKSYKLLKEAKKVVIDEEVRDSILELEAALANYSNSRVSFNDIGSFSELKENLQKIVVFLEEFLSIGRKNNSTSVFKDYYQILDIGRDATPEEIKKAYRKTIFKVHPDRKKAQIDRLDDEELKGEIEGIYNEKFQKIQEAYEVLSDPEKRKEYNIQYDKHPKS